jgi:uncharacterized membrane protein
MIYILYVGVGLMALIFGGIFIGGIGAAIYDLWYQRRYRAFIELERDHSKPRRPACK